MNHVLARVLLLWVFFLTGLAHPAQALAEHIISFEAVISVRPDGLTEVTETITALAQGRTIRRGIYRDLMKPPFDWIGVMSGQPYQVLEVRRGSKPEIWRMEDKGGSIRIYVGHKDSFLTPGVYTWTLRYLAASQVRFFGKYDEIYWNVTGNSWSFPIERVRAVFIVPPGANILQFAGYTGPRGAQGLDFTVKPEGQGRLVFQTTRALQQGEGFTAAVAWPKGFVASPSTWERLRHALSVNRMLAASLGLFALLMAYYLAAWYKVGRDPDKGTIIPLYAPPPDISPAAARYISLMGYDAKDLPCTIVSLAVQGLVTITERDKEEFSLKLRNEQKAASRLDEDSAMRILFKDGSPLEVERSNRTVLNDAQGALRKALRDSYTGYLFNPNLGWFWPGVAIALAAALTAVFSGPSTDQSLFMAVWLSIWTAGTVMLLSRVAASWHEAVKGRGSFMAWAGAIFITAFATPFVLGEFAGLFFLGAATTPLAAAILLASGSACAAFYHLLKAPTEEGRRIMDQIEGFALYLGVAEEERLNLVNPPEETPELFEKFLPYAMALGLEHQWGERFAQVLERAAQSPDGYTPGWYHGSSWDVSSPGDFSQSLSSGFSSAMASSSGSSGSDGGGGSGGGGGGGGGGGW